MIRLAAALVAVAGLWVTRKKATKPVAPWMWKVAIWSFPLALAANIMGWVFTEMGRQPWIVFGLMSTRDGVSPGVSGLEVLISLIAFTAIYAALAVVEVRLIVKAAKKGPDGLVEYQQQKNRFSIDGLPTGLPPDPAHESVESPE